MTGHRLPYGRTQHLTQQAKKAIYRRDDVSQATYLRIGQTYVHGLVPEQPNPLRLSSGRFTSRLIPLPEASFDG